MKRHAVRLLCMLAFCIIAIASATTEENVSQECRLARADHSFCMSACLGRTPGNWTIMQSMGYCGNQCGQSAIGAARACRN
jgi:hypothetical protein